MRIFVFGATGVLGRALLPRLQRAHHDIRALARSPQQAQAVGPGLEKFCGEVGRAAAHRNKWAVAAVFFCL